jgi:hypothetical protein
MSFSFDWLMSSIVQGKHPICGRKEVIQNKDEKRTTTCLECQVESVRASVLNSYPQSPSVKRNSLPITTCGFLLSETFKRTDVSLCQSKAHF